MVCRSERRGKWGWPSEIYRVGRETFWNRRKKDREFGGSTFTAPKSLCRETDDHEDLRKDESQAGTDGGLPKATGESIETGQDPAA